MTKEEVAAANFGKFPDDYRDQITEHMKYFLKDPYSAVYEFHEPYRAVIASPIYSRKIYGWGIDVDINEKNLHGAYIGMRTYQFFIREGGYFEVLPPFLKNAEPLLAK